LRGSSFAMSSRIRTFTLRLARSSPLRLWMALEKKNLSSTVPWGECMYLLVVTRLTVDSCMPMSSATSLRMRGRR